MQTIYLVRHGETEWNRAGRWQGRQDSPLTQLGEAQARSVGALLRDLIPDPDTCSMIVSPLGRAMRTAAIVSDMMGIDAARFAVDPMVREQSGGNWEGLSIDEITATDPDGLRRFQADSWTYGRPGGETLEELSERARLWLESVRHLPTVLLVSHGAFGRMVRRLYLRLPRESFQTLPNPQGAVLRLFQGTVAQIDPEPVDTP